MAHSVPVTPYCGFVRDPQSGIRTVAESGPHVLVSAPTGAGKTRSVLAPAAVLWGGPAVVVSSKDDLFQLVAQRRYGPQALIDLRPDYDADYPGIETMSFDPTRMITTPDQAVTAANTSLFDFICFIPSGLKTENVTTPCDTNMTLTWRT